MEQSYTSNGQASGMGRHQACRFRPLDLLLVFVCLSPVISTVPQVEAGPVDLLLEDFTALLQRAQRLEQVGVPVFQRLQQHLNAFVSGVVTKEEAQDLLWKGVVENDRLKIERAFLAGADLEVKRDTWTPLTNASYHGRLEAVRALVKLEARLEGRGGWWQGTALHMASYKGHEAVARLLLVAGANVGAGENDKGTPLHLASGEGHEAVARLLLEAGARLEAKTEYGSRPLFYAAANGRLPVVKLLVEAGAELSPRNTDGLTPLSYAENRRHSAVAAYLRSVGATK